MKKDILSLSEEELGNEAFLKAQPGYRAKQIYDRLHTGRVTDFDEMTQLPLRIRQQLKDGYVIPTVKVYRELVSKSDGTVKYAFELPDGNIIESVLTQYRHGMSLCVSTQVGCKMGCVFCASGKDGLVRNLNPSEILGQVYKAEQLTSQTVQSVVLMGIGEPLDNYVNVTKFLELYGKHRSLRNVSLSTCGLIPKIYELAELRLGLTLCISLHASNDKARSEIMPINRVYSIHQLISAAKYYRERTSRRITFEYA
ncbi:MAG: radical SAM protein, partial [Oscillospiraceae bacterium]|nr:radical SAM protein [Oscillospiraceae bacterium]